MQYFRIKIIAVVAVIAAYSASWANDTPEKFLPLPASNKNMRSVNAAPSAVPHFFPLQGRLSSRLATHSAAIAPQDDDIPVAHEGKPEAMTQEQASQILSLFGSSE